MALSSAFSPGYHFISRFSNSLKPPAGAQTVPDGDHRDAGRTTCLYLSIDYLSTDHLPIMRAEVTGVFMWARACVEGSRGRCVRGNQCDISVSKHGVVSVLVGVCIDAICMRSGSHMRKSTHRGSQCATCWSSHRRWRCSRAVATPSRHATSPPSAGGPTWPSTRCAGSSAARP